MFVVCFGLILFIAAACFFDVVETHVVCLCCLFGEHHILQTNDQVQTGSIMFLASHNPKNMSLVPNEARDLLLVLVATVLVLVGI